MLNVEVGLNGRSINMDPASTEKKLSVDLRALTLVLLVNAESGLLAKMRGAIVENARR